MSDARTASMTLFHHQSTAGTSSRAAQLKACADMMGGRHDASVQSGVAPVQRTLKVGPVQIEPEHIDFVVEQVMAQSRKILAVYESGTPGSEDSASWMAYSKGIPQMLLHSTDEVRAIVGEWVTASGSGAMAPTKESISERMTGVRGKKAFWKEYGDFLEATIAIGYELHPETLANREHERALGTSILQNEGVNHRLNDMRIRIMKWIQMKYGKDGDLMGTFEAKFKLGGSYNLGNLKGITRSFTALLNSPELAFIDNIEIIHDLMELTSEAGGGSIVQNLPGSKVLTQAPSEHAYQQIGVTSDGDPYRMLPMKSESDHGPGGGAWRAAKHYTLKMFERQFQEFEEQRGQDIELQELDAAPSGMRADKLHTRYKDAHGRKMDKAITYAPKPPVSALGRLRDSVLRALELKQKPNTLDAPTLDKRSKGRHNVGTRNEFDPVTVIARSFNAPIEAGRSMTTARLLEMCRQVLADSDEVELQGKGQTELDAVAHAIFAYWAAAYNTSLTPVHTYHEVMDVASTYGVEYRPFHYRELNGDMSTSAHVPMNTKRPVKETVPKRWELKPEIRGLPYRISAKQRNYLKQRGLVERWIDPDGDCFYGALIANGVAIGSIRDMRRQLSEYFLAHIDDYRGFLAGANEQSVAADIRRPYSYAHLGGDLTPKLICDFLGIGISIVDENGATTRINDGGSDSNILLHVKNPLPHYHAVSIDPAALTEGVELGNMAE